MKISLYLKYLFGLLLLISTSCERLDGETVVEGQVVDRHTGQPIPNATVSVYSRKDDASAYNGQEFEKQADRNGNFSFRFEGESNKSYALLGFKDPGYYTVWVDAANLEEGRNNKNLKLKMQAPAWVKVKIVNTEPKIAVTRLHIQSFEDMVDGYPSVTLMSFQKDTSFVRRVEGSKKSIFLYSITTFDGKTVETNPTVFFPALDTTDLLIEY